MRLSTRRLASGCVSATSNAVSSRTFARAPDTRTAHTHAEAAHVSGTVRARHSVADACGLHCCALTGLCRQQRRLRVRLLQPLQYGAALRDDQRRLLLRCALPGAHHQAGHGVTGVDVPIHLRLVLSSQQVHGGGRVSQAFVVQRCSYAPRAARAPVVEQQQVGRLRRGPQRLRTDGSHSTRRAERNGRRCVEQSRHTPECVDDGDRVLAARCSCGVDQQEQLRQPVPGTTVLQFESGASDFAVSGNVCSAATSLSVCAYTQY